MDPDHLSAVVASAPLLAALLGLVLGGLGLAWLRRTRIARRIHDQPNHRSLHQAPIPRIGGIALTAAIALATLAAWRIGDTPLATVLGCALLLGLISLVDDLRALPSVVRLVCHLAAGAVVLWFLGDAGWHIVWLVVVLAWMTNLYNFMDGSDGLAGSMAAIGFGTYALAAHGSGDPLLAATAALLAGAAVGFLAHNLPPARIFMGDAGSIPLGFLAGALGWLGVERRDWPITFPLLVFLPFWLDATATLARRIVTGRRFWQAHREHFYQRLVLSGAGHRGTLAWYAAFMVVCAVAAMATLGTVPGRAASIIVLLMLFAGAGAAAIERRYRRRAADVALYAPPQDADRDHL